MGTPNHWDRRRFLAVAGGTTILAGCAAEPIEDGETDSPSEGDGNGESNDTGEEQEDNPDEEETESTEDNDTEPDTEGELGNESEEGDEDEEDTETSENSPTEEETPTEDSEEETSTEEQTETSTEETSTEEQTETPTEEQTEDETPTDEETATEDDDDSPDNSTDGDSRTTIGFGGDTMVGRDLNAIYGPSDVDPAAVWGDLRPRLESLDGVCCNLECCLSTRGERYPNRSYYFRGDPAWAIPALEAGNVQFTSLANNHAMDYGEVALLDTIDALEGSGIDVAGAGETPDEAQTPASFTVGDVDVAVVSFADHPWGYAATEDSTGTTFARTDLDNDDTLRIVGDMVDRARALEPDLLIASVHWGWNWKEVPSDELREFGHWLVDLGVDLVHGHSAHVVQAIERYDDGVILHNCGDLVNDFGIKDDLGNDRSFLFEVSLEDAQIDEIRLVPIEIDNGVDLASAEAAAWLRETIRERSSDFETTYERDGHELVVRF